MVTLFKFLVCSWHRLLFRALDRFQLKIVKIVTLLVPQSRVPMTLVVLLRMIYFCFCTTPFFSGVWPLWPQQWPCRICYWCSQLWAELSFSLLLTRLLTLLADFAVVGELLWWPQYCQIYLYKMVMTLLS